MRRVATIASKALLRESVRHAIASVAAAAVAALILTAGFFLGLLQNGPQPGSIFTTLLFGFYGPAFLLLSWLTFRGVEGEQLRVQVARNRDRSRVLRWLFLSSPTSWASTVLGIGIASVILLTTGEQSSVLWIVPVCAAGVAGTWVLMVGVMAMEYMRSWARHDSIQFPGDDARTFTDFIYLAVQMSTTFSSADVSFTRRGTRNLATLHSILAFAYSTTIIAVFASLLIGLTS